LIRAADFARDMAQVRGLIEEYVVWLDCDLSFQDVDHEVAHLDTVYGASFLVAESGPELIGCVGLKPFAPGTAEFSEIAAYYDSPLEGTRYVELLFSAKAVQ
jgi:hypothetical protein